MQNEQKVVVVGAGPAGGQALVSLRRAGFKGKITLVGAERYLPYERPPLSKHSLLNDAGDDALVLPGCNHLADQNVEFESGVEVVSLDRPGRTILLSDGRSLSYDALLLSTGARVRQLDIPGADKSGVLYLRTLDDSLALKSRLKPGVKLVVIGGGFIGLEAASTARKLGCEVTVVEATTQIMDRVVPPVIAEFFTRSHKAEGTDIRVGVAPLAIEGGTNVEAVTLVNGDRVEADVVLIGIGVLPNVELAEQSGLEVNNGIVVDAQCRTSDPAIFAAGDVTRHFNPALGKSVRLEAWEPCINQATVAAEVIAGADTQYADIPWVWTNQCDSNLQIAGFADQYDELAIRGEADSEAFTVFQLKDQTVVGVMTINRSSEMSVGKRLIGSKVPLVDLMDESIKLRKLVKRN